MPRPSSKVDKSVSIVSQTLQGLGTRLNVLEYHKKTSKQHYTKIISSGTEQNNHETNDTTNGSKL